jgi:hypothetical protein
MILPDFILRSRVNQNWSYSGIDSIDWCKNKKHFESYPHKISYNYNSRGFRDAEWPNDLDKLKNAVWCVGDSFTVGLGSPIEHTWVYQVSKQLKKQTINVSMDGASNEWIARKVIQICETVSPKLIIIQWSYTNRREHKNLTLSDEARRIHCEKHAENNDIENTISCIESVIKKSTSNVIHSFIPNCGATVDVDRLWENIQGQDWPACPTNLVEFQQLEKFVVDELKTVIQEYDSIKNHFEWKILLNKINHVPEIVRLDLARDGHHYDLLTAQQFARDVSKLLCNVSI